MPQLQQQPTAGIAIVAEGGGQRGIFTAGVLDAFQHENFNPFSIGYGVSAGAQNLFSYFMGMPGYARRAIAEISVKPKFFVPYRWFGRCGMLDLDSYFAHLISDENFGLPYRQTQAVAERRQLYFVATSRSTLRASYLDPDPSNVFQYLKASSAVPLLYKEGVRIGDETMIDGAVSDPLPVKQAYKLGARNIVVLRTVPDTKYCSYWGQWLSSLKIDKALPSQYWQMLDTHERAYKDALDFIENPPADVTLSVIAPQEPLKSVLIGSNSTALRADYLVGRREGARVLPTLAQTLGVALEQHA